MSVKTLRMKAEDGTIYNVRPKPLRVNTSNWVDGPDLVFGPSQYYLDDGREVIRDPNTGEFHAGFMKLTPIDE